MPESRIDRAERIGAFEPAAGTTRRGGGQAENQDRYVVEVLDRPGASRGLLLAVADGVGGGPAGGRASALAIHRLRKEVRRRPGAVETTAGFLRRAALRCHAALRQDMARHPHRRGMGTTLTAALAVDGRLELVHVGDSRAYLFRDGRLSRLTRDHTGAECLVAIGLLAREDIRTSRWRRVLWNVVGGSGPRVRPESHSFVARPGDGLLLCTDGLTEVVPDEALERTLAAEGTSEEICRELAERARVQGGRDDITVVHARL